MYDDEDYIKACYLIEHGFYHGDVFDLAKQLYQARRPK